MKTKFLFLIQVLILLCASVAIAEETKYNFRRVKWGMTKAQVKAAETSKLRDENNDGLLYRTKAATLSTNLLYSFAENKLVRAGYMFKDTHSNENAYIDDYQRVKRILTKKYGQPEKDREKWSNDLYKSRRQDWGVAVSIGHLIYLSEWRTTRTTIRLGLIGDNFKITHVVQYISIKLAPLAEKQKKSKEADDF